MTHLWIRAESRPNEERVGITPDGVRSLRERGIAVTLEKSATRILPAAEYADAGATIAVEGSWTSAPADALIYGLKELPDDGTPLRHRHIMFGHAFKGQPDGQRLLRRFAAGGGALFDLEYLVEESGRRVAAFGFWAGYAGAAVSLLAWAAQRRGAQCPPVSTWADEAALQSDIGAAMDGTGPRPTAIVIGALGRVGTGARDLCARMGVPTTDWDLAETAHGGPFPEVLAHDIFLNCILANPGCPVFVPAEATTARRNLSVIGDIACDPTSDFSPIKVYDRATSWSAPTIRAHDAPPLDVMAIDNLPSLLPRESSLDFAEQMLPHLAVLDAPDALEQGVWGRAHNTFRKHLKEVQP